MSDGNIYSPALRKSGYFRDGKVRAAKGRVMAVVRLAEEVVDGWPRGLGNLNV